MKFSKLIPQCRLVALRYSFKRVTLPDVSKEQLIAELEKTARSLMFLP